MDADWHEQRVHGEEMLGAFPSRIGDGLGMAATAMLGFLSLVNGIVSLGLSFMAFGMVMGFGAGVAQAGPGANFGGYTTAHLLSIGAMFGALCVLLLPLVSSVCGTFGAFLLLRGGRRSVLYLVAGIAVLGPLILAIASVASVAMLGTMGVLTVVLAGCLVVLSVLASALAVLSVSRSPYPVG